MSDVMLANEVLLFVQLWQEASVNGDPVKAAEAVQQLWELHDIAQQLLEKYYDQCRKSYEMGVSHESRGG